MAALRGPGDKRGAAVKLGERGTWESALSGTACSVPKEGSPGRERFPSSLEELPSWDFFRVPVFEFPFVWKAFFRGWNIINPPWRLFCTPPFIVSVVERSTLYTRVPGSSPTFRVFLFFMYVGFSMTLIFVLIV